MGHYMFGKLVSLPFDAAVQRITEELAKVERCAHRGDGPERHPEPGRPQGRGGDSRRGQAET